MQLWGKLSLVEFLWTTWYVRLKYRHNQIKLITFCLYTPVFSLLLTAMKSCWPCPKEQGTTIKAAPEVFSLSWTYWTNVDDKLILSIPPDEKNVLCVTGAAVKLYPTLNLSPCSAPNIFTGWLPLFWISSYFWTTSVGSKITCTCCTFMPTTTEQSLYVGWSGWIIICLNWLHGERAVCWVSQTGF